MDFFAPPGSLSFAGINSSGFCRSSITRASIVAATPPYSISGDFTAIALVAKAPLSVAVNRNLPFSDLKGMFAHAKELAPNLLGEDPNDIARLFTKLLWAGASMGRAGLTTQAIAASLATAYGKNGLPWDFRTP